MRGHNILCASRGETKQKIRHYWEFSTLVWLKSVKSDYTSLQWCVHRDTHPLGQRQETFWSKVHSRQPQETNTCWSSQIPLRNSERCFLALYLTIQPYLMLQGIFQQGTNHSKLFSSISRNYIYYHPFGEHPLLLSKLFFPPSLQWILQWFTFHACNPAKWEVYVSVCRTGQDLDPQPFCLTYNTQQQSLQTHVLLVSQDHCNLLWSRKIPRFNLWELHRLQ